MHLESTNFLHKKDLKKSSSPIKLFIYFRNEILPFSGRQCPHYDKQCHKIGKQCPNSNRQCPNSGGKVLIVVDSVRKSKNAGGKVKYK